MGRSRLRLGVLKHLSNVFVGVGEVYKNGLRLDNQGEASQKAGREKPNGYLVEWGSLRLGRGPRQRSWQGACCSSPPAGIAQIMRKLLSDSFGRRIPRRENNDGGGV